MPRHYSIPPNGSNRRDQPPQEVSRPQSEQQRPAREPYKGPSRANSAQGGGFVLREGQGSLLINKKHVAGDNKPSMTGTVMIDGKLREIAVWTKVSAAGNKWLSVQVKAPDESAEEAPQETPPYEEESQERPEARRPNPPANSDDSVIDRNAPEIPWTD